MERGVRPLSIAAVASLVPPILGLAASALLLGACASCQSTVQQTSVPILAAGGFDGAELDASAQTLYFADRADLGIDAVDVGSATPRFIKTIALGAAPNGLAVASDRHRLYAGLTGGAVAVIDIDSRSTSYLSVVNRIQVNQVVVDLLDYSAAAKRVFASAAEGGEIDAIDPATNTVVQRYKVNLPIEQPRYDSGDHMLYATTPAVDTLLQIDPSSGRVVQRFRVPKCHAAGLGVSPAHQDALVACSGGIAIVNLVSGKYSVSRDVSGGDVVSYTAAADRFVVASPHGVSDSAVGVYAGDGTFLGSVTATPKAHAAAFDAAAGKVYAVSGAGLMSFTPGACAPPPWWLGVFGQTSLYAAPIVVIALVLFLYARSRDADRERPKTKTRWRQRLDDEAEERDRMRALEASILDPPPDRPQTSG